MAQAHFQIPQGLWSLPGGSDEQAEPEMAGSLFEHSTRGTFSQGRRGHRQSPGSQQARRGPRGQGGANWGYCPNNLSGNASTRPPSPKVKGITMGSLFQSSKASLTTPSKASLQDAQHTSPPPAVSHPASLNWETTLPRTSSWPSSLLPSTHLVSLVTLVVHSRRPPCF